MVHRYIVLSKDFMRECAEKLPITSRESKATLFGIAAILGSCWGISKVYYWNKKSKIKRRIEQERDQLRNSKERLLQELKNDTVLFFIK